MAEAAIQWWHASDDTQAIISVALDDLVPLLLSNLLHLVAILLFLEGALLTTFL